jgi:tetratricopeptide (TPR) repeat protein
LVTVEFNFQERPAEEECLVILLNKIFVSSLVCFSLLSLSCSKQAGDEAKGRLAPLLEGMGDLHHAITTTNETAQRYFNQGLTLSYAFNHKEAERAFRETARLDPHCAMAYWGIALVLGPNINAAMDNAEIPNAYSAIQKALALAPKASEKEQAYINALSKRYTNEAVADRKPLDEAYANAMREVAQKFPDDPDAAALFAEALMDLHPWKYWEKDGQPKPWTPEIVSTLETGLQKWPQHPGFNHFYIHAVEASANPERAMASADWLGNFAPSAGHLVHMPAHIFIRTGRYNDAIVANERAIEADSNYITQCHAQGMYPVAYVPHNHHFLSAAATFGGNSEKALMAAHHMAMNQDRKLMREPGYGTLQHYMTIPLYAMIKFGKWEDILKEVAPDSDLLYPQGVWHFARGMAHARTNQLDNAAQELNKLKNIAADTSLKYVTIWDINTTYDLLQIATEMLSGELAAKKGNFTKAIDHLKKAVAHEDNLTYDEPPPWYTPARHNLGAVLLEASRAAEAQKVFEDDLKKYPENGWSLFGLQQSLLAQGKKAAADAVAKRLERAWGGADVTLTAARF